MRKEGAPAGIGRAGALERKCPPDRGDCKRESGGELAGWAVGQRIARFGNDKRGAVALNGADDNLLVRSFRRSRSRNRGDRCAGGWAGRWSGGCGRKGGGP